MLAIPPFGASSNRALWWANNKLPVELLVDDLESKVFNRNVGYYVNIVGGKGYRYMMEFEEIKKVIKQRFPIIMVDRVLDMVPRNKITAIKNVTGNEIFFMGHFPQHYILPGALIIEALSQAASIMVGSIEIDEFLVLGAVNQMRFIKSVFPGDVLVMKIKMIKAIENYFYVECEAKVDDTIVAKGKLTFAKTTYIKD